MTHESGGIGFGPTILLVPQQPGPNFEHFTVIYGIILRPPSSGSNRVSNGHYGFAEYASRSDQFTIGKRWWVICRAQDAYGWWWEQWSGLVEFTRWQSPAAPEGGYELPVTVGVPAIVVGAYPDEAELRALREHL